MRCKIHKKKRSNKLPKCDRWRPTRQVSTYSHGTQIQAPLELDERVNLTEGRFGVRFEP